jgi:hypothetical protein
MFSNFYWLECLKSLLGKPRRLFCFIKGTAKNLALLVLSVANFYFLAEGRRFINALQVIFATPAFITNFCLSLTSFPLGF